MAKNAEKGGEDEKKEIGALFKELPLDNDEGRYGNKILGLTIQRKR